MKRQIEQLYNDIIGYINEIDKKAEYWKGKRDAYNDIRLDLFNMIKQDNNGPEGAEDEKTD